MTNDKKVEHLKCQDCGVINDTVKITFCPYAQELNGEKIEITVCDDCYVDRGHDI